MRFTSSVIELFGNILFLRPHMPACLYYFIYFFKKWKIFFFLVFFFCSYLKQIFFNSQISVMIIDIFLIYNLMVGHFSVSIVQMKCLRGEIFHGHCYFRIFFVEYFEICLSLIRIQLKFVFNSAHFYFNSAQI